MFFCVDPEHKNVVAFGRHGIFENLVFVIGKDLPEFGIVHQLLKREDRRGGFGVLIAAGNKRKTHGKREQCDEDFFHNVYSLFCLDNL